MSQCHPTAIVSPDAELAKDVRVGPYAVIGAGVALESGCVVGAHAVLEGPTRIGAGCRIGSFSSIGGAPQDLKYGGEITRLEIGPGNDFREYVTVNRGTEGGGGVTTIGQENFFMAYAHVAHDCIIGNRTIFANAATLAGHVEVQDGANIGAFSGVHQFCRIGKEAFIGGYSVITQDAMPFVKSVGNRAKAYGINTVGLQRRGHDSEAIEALKRAYRLLSGAGLNTGQATDRIENELGQHEDCLYLVSFIRSSKRGVVK